MMAFLEASIYHGCIRCDGLFTTSTHYSQHAVLCTGERQKSDCQLFACPRDQFLAFCESEVIRTTIVDCNSGNISDGGIGGVPVSVPGCYTSPLRKVKVIGIVKKTLSQFPQNDKVFLCSDSTDQEAGTQPLVTSPEKSFHSEIVPGNCDSFSKKCVQLHQLVSPMTQESNVNVSDNEPSQSSLGYTPNKETPHISSTVIKDLNPQTKSTTEVEFQPAQPQGSSNIASGGPQYPKCNQVQDIPERFSKELNEINCVEENQDSILTSTGIQFNPIPAHLPKVTNEVNADPYGLYTAAEEVDELRKGPEEPPQEISSVALGQPEQQTVFQCKVCGLESYNEGYLQRHSQSHETAPKSDFQMKKLKTFLCELCPLQFKSRSSLTRHSAKKHNGKSNFMCEYCGCGFVAVNSANLRDHTRKHTGEWLACDYDNCNFTTKFEKALVLHKAKHQGKTRFICEVCGYRTIEAGSFKRHCLNHTDKKLFKCPDCSYKANSRYSIVKHIYGKHINHKRFACNRCDYKTAYYSGLSLHLMSHEGVKPYKCSACSYRSNLSNKVKRHCTQKHKGGDARVDKVENCLKFDVKDYLNPEVQKLEVKVLRLGEDSTEEDVYSCGPVVPSAPIGPDISEDGALLCETNNLSSLPSDSAETLEAISMIDGGFNLCSDPTFQLDSVSHAFPSDDSNNAFVSRPTQMICEQDVELMKDLDAQKTKLLYMEPITCNLPIQKLQPQDISDMSGSKSNMFSNIDIPGLETLENTAQKANSEESASENQQSNSSLDIVLKSVPKDTTALKTKHPILSSLNPFFQVITVPLINVPNLLLQQAKDAQSTVGIRPLTTVETVKDSQNMAEVQTLKDQPLTDTNPTVPVTFALPVGSQSETSANQIVAFQSTTSFEQLATETSLQHHEDV